MLVTVDKAKVKKSILPFVFMQMTKTNDRGYNLGYAEVSHPGISKGIDKLNKLVGTEVIKEATFGSNLFSHPQYLKKNSIDMNVWKHDLNESFSQIFH